MVRVDLRTGVLDVPPQDVISRDNVSVQGQRGGLLPRRRSGEGHHPGRDFDQATSQLAQTTLRSVLGQHELDEMLAEREKLNADIQRILDEQTDAWGIKVVERRDQARRPQRERWSARSPRQAEAERVRRAKIIDAEGELQAAEKLVQAGADPGAAAGGDAAALSRTLANIAGEKSSTIVFPLPIDLLSGLRGSLREAPSDAS